MDLVLHNGLLTSYWWKIDSNFTGFEYDLKLLKEQSESHNKIIA